MPRRSTATALMTLPPVAAACEGARANTELPPTTLDIADFSFVFLRSDGVLPNASMISRCIAAPNFLAGAPLGVNPSNQVAHHAH